MPPGNNKKILIIDDDDAVRTSIAACLRARDFTALQAADGLAGLAALRQDRPDLILLDLRLPDIDGLDVLATVTKESPDTPVVIISGAGTMKDSIRALQLGAWDYLVKPILETAVLEHAIGKALERAELLRERRRYREQLEEEVKNRTAELEQRSRELERAYQILETEVNDRKRAERAVHRERAVLQTIIDGVIDPAQVVSLDHQVIMMNQAARDHLPIELKKTDTLLCHQMPGQFLEPCAEHTPCPMDKIKETGKAVTMIRKYRDKNNAEHAYEITASPLWNEDGSMRGFLEIFRNLTDSDSVEAKLRDHESRLYHLSHHDPLTNLPNRLLFQDRLQMMMIKAQRHKHQVAILFLDLDRFKKINETLGHEVGDRMLVEIGQRLQNTLRKSDTVARMSGDEFAIILDDIRDARYVGVVARKIKQALAKHIQVGDYELFISTSIGISIYPTDGTEVEGLMRCADTAIFRAKEMGRNTYQFYTTDMNTRAFEFLLMESGLRRALEQNELVIFYQPQFNMTDHRLIGMEALLRWQHPEKGMIAPGDFIPLAEETGLIEPIGEWVLRTACAQNKSWQNQGYPPISLAVNLSARQFRQQNILELVADTLAETGLEPKYLELELTESIVMNNVEKNVRTLEELSRLGVQLAIDDFGTGYSSLSYLKLFPIDNLKIDRSFVRNINTNPNDAMIAASIIALAHNMNLKVLAEGVEDEKQLQLLLKQGCDNVQGFLFGRPVPAEEFVRFFKESP
ncbi:MAG: hypothetical protein A2521_00795 [Deltaproteobacteria bacterium RIFOXYD12_FULL_57_12]|nr:MAG: hypothetical protein A2521_00795 [Deltaproteobacteria bacterium RIFOXYD12_FULL_57_12]